MDVYVVVYNDESEVQREGSVHVTVDDAMQAGETLARAKWDEMLGSPFPAAEDAWEAMDKLRVHTGSMLEIETFSMSEDVIRTLYSKIGN